MRPEDGPTVTVAAVETLVPVPTVSSPAAAEDSAERAAPADTEISATTVVPPTTEMSAPTSTWVVFEEVEDPPAPAVFDRVRIPQAEDAAAGAMYWYMSGSFEPGYLPPPFEHAGKVFDLCSVEDAHVDLHRRRAGASGPSREFKRDWFRYRAPGDCRGHDLALARPLLGVWPGRYFTFDDDGRKSPYLVSPQEAAEWYREHAGAPGAPQQNTIPLGMAPAGLFGRFSSRVTELADGQPWIHYSDAGDTVDEVRVLPDSVAVGNDGTLRGLVRNWSRTLWAYGTVVGAGEGEWAWPLSIQPGELAPFEITDWGGPADAALIDFSVTTEMSGDVDLSRAWWGWWDWQYYDSTSDFGASDPEFDRYTFSRLDPISHTLGDAEWASGLTLELAVYAAELDPDGNVTEVGAYEFHESGPRRDIPDEAHLGDGGPLVRWYYPRTVYWTSEVGFLRHYGSHDDSWVAWIGMPHPRVDQ